MIPELSTTDLWKTGTVYVLTTLLTVIWLYRSSQNKIPKTALSVFGIAIRNLIAHGLFVVVLCGWGTWTVDQIFSYSPLWLILFTLSFPQVMSRLPIAAGLGSGIDIVDFIAMAFILACLVVFVGPLFLLRQLVVGFVDIRAVARRFSDWQREPFTPHKNPPPQHALDDVVAPGTQAVVVATLRPLGKVQIGDQVYDARHTLGQFVETNTSVKVKGSRDGMLLVSDCSESSTDK